LDGLSKWIYIIPDIIFMSDIFLKFCLMWKISSEMRK